MISGSGWDGLFIDFLDPAFPNIDHVGLGSGVRKGDVPGEMELITSSNVKVSFSRDESVLWEITKIIPVRP